MSDEHNTNGIPDNAPWWAKTGMQIAMTFGMPTLIMCFLLAREAGWVPNPVAEELEVIKGVIVQGNTTNQEIIKALKEQNQQRQMRCVMKAKTDDEKKACFPSKRDDD